MQLLESRKRRCGKARAPGARRQVNVNPTPSTLHCKHPWFNVHHLNPHVSPYITHSLAAPPKQKHGFRTVTDTHGRCHQAKGEPLTCYRPCLPSRYDSSVLILVYLGHRDFPTYHVGDSQRLTQARTSQRYEREHFKGDAFQVRHVVDARAVS